MLLDQQIPMERAFLGPAVLAERLGQRPLDPRAIAAWDPEDVRAICATPPAVHRFPRSWPGGSRPWPRPWSSDYDGDTASLWRSADSGEEVRARLEALPGFGAGKAAIFIALLGKQLGVRPRGWREASAPYGEPGRPVRGRRRRRATPCTGPRVQEGGQGGRPGQGPLSMARFAGRRRAQPAVPGSEHDAPSVLQWSSTRPGSLLPPGRPRSPQAPVTSPSARPRR